ncbi:MAG: hypothetical protein P1P72_07015 [ANME-2 cluster archaeon]|nr:hypothetical protein [ANME-2 cluster archaeon]
MRQELKQLVVTIPLFFLVFTLGASALVDQVPVIATDRPYYNPWDTVNIIVNDTSELTAWIIDPQGNEIPLVLVPSDSGYRAEYSPQQGIILGTYTVVASGPQVNDTTQFEIIVTTTGNLTINTTREVYEAGQKVELSVISPQGIPVVWVTDPMGISVAVKVTQENGVYTGTFRPDRQIVLGQYQAEAESYANGSKEHATVVFTLSAPTNPQAISFSSGVEFLRDLSGPRTGQHKVPPETNIHVTVTVNIEGSLYNTNLVDYFPKDWIVTNPNNGIVSAYDAQYNMITWPVSINGSMTKWYTIESPQRTTPPTSYNFFTGLGGNTSGLWKVMVADPTNTYYFHPETVNVGVDGIRKIANSTDNTGDTTDDTTAGPLYTSGNPATFTEPPGFRFYTDPVFSSPFTFTSDTTITMWFDNNYNDSNNGPIHYKAIIYDYNPATGSNISLGSDEQDFIQGLTQLTFTIPTNNTSVAGGHRVTVVFQVNGTDRTDDYRPAIVYDSTTNNSRMTFSYVVDTPPPGTPTELIIFTDKKVYTDWIIKSNPAKGGPASVIAYQGTRAVDLKMYVYAVVLDESGKIMTGRTINGTLDDIERLDHQHKADISVHHNVMNNPSFYDNISFNLNDDGTLSGIDVANDGIYVAEIDLLDIDTTNATNLLEDHLKLNITVTDTGVGTRYTYVLLSALRCHQDTDPTSHPIQHTGSNDEGTALCVVCHSGSEHFFETISGTIPEPMLDVHVGRMNPPGIYTDSSNDFSDFIWNSSKIPKTGVGNIEWNSVVPGTRYCAACHFTTGKFYDYGNGDRTALTDRPSCNVASVSQNTASGQVLQTITCHDTTEMMGTTTPAWNTASAVSTHALNYDIYKAKSHNHSGSVSNVSCAVCHGTTHSLTMPNMSADITSSGNINNQCFPCHSNTGPTNSLKYPHDSGTTDCKACHMDSSKSLNVHLVPEAVIPNPNCSQCHDLGGMALYLIDYNTLNKSDYVHNQLNISEGRYPLNYNASIGSASRPADDRLCWACHGEDDNGDGIANYSEQPASGHPVNYMTPRACEDCHQNASAPWNAPQNVAHSNASSDIQTPGALHCYDCHGNDVMYNRSHRDDDFHFNLKNSLAAHYDIGFTELKALRGTTTYCILYCHQNTSSPFRDVFDDFENMELPNHSSMNSRPQNQSCVATQCHAATALHDALLKKPTLESGQFGNENCTAIECHDPAMFRNHNNIVNCTSCHMDNSGPNIHPIKYLQNNGWDFAQMNYTAADCNLCHKEDLADAKMSEWGLIPAKVGTQHHSDDPGNGSIWNKTSEPFWTYVPYTITYVSGWQNNSVRGFLTDFAAMQDTNVSSTIISENTTDDSFVGYYPDNTDLAVNATGWVSSDTLSGTSAYSGTIGNTPGAITVSSIKRNDVVDSYWNANFTYPRSNKVAEVIVKLDSMLVIASDMNTTATRAINVSIDDNRGNVTEVYSRILPSNPESRWVESGDISVPNPDTVFWKNGDYTISIRTRFSALNTKTVNIKTAYDNVHVDLYETDYKKYNFTLYINNTPPSDRYSLFIGYHSHMESAELYVMNNSLFELKANLNVGAFTSAIIPLSQQEFNNGNITLLIKDSNGPGTTPADIDVHASWLDIEYLFVRSYGWVNNRSVLYPCEYCHAPDNHYEYALGLPYFFKGTNYVGQQVNSSTTWCASCHYQGYVSGGNSYSDMVNSFLNHSLPVPPEITGHPEYGVNASIDPDYFNHTGFSMYNDSECWTCHKGHLPEGTNSTVFMHYVSTGVQEYVNFSVNKTIAPGPGLDNYTITLNLTNPDISNQTNLSVYDLVPVNFTIINPVPNYNGSNATRYYWTMDLMAGESKVVTYTMVATGRYNISDVLTVGVF